MPDLVLSKFYKLKEKANSNQPQARQNRVNKQDFLDFYGSTQEEQKMDEAIRENANSLFAERYAKETPAKGTIETNINETVGGIFQDKEIGYFEEGKRANHAKSRIKVQRHLQNEQTMYLRHTKDIKRHLSLTMKKDDLAKLKERYKEGEEQDALKQWMVSDVYDTARSKIMTADLFGNLVSDEDKVRGNALNNIMKTLPRMMKPEEFTFKSDREFVSNFARKYELLCKAACADVFFSQLQKMSEDGKYDPNYSLIESKATIDMCKELKVYYEERMEMIRSPYYTLLAKKDLDAYENPDGSLNEDKLGEEVKAGNEGFVSYLKKYLRLKNSPMGKGRDIQAIFNEKVESVRDQFRDRDVKRVDNSGIDLEKPAAENYAMLMERGRAEHYRQNEKKSDLEYLKSTKPNASMTKIAGLDKDNISDFEQLIIEICEKKTINNVPVKDEDVKHVQSALKQLVQARKKMNAMYAGFGASDAAVYNGIDVRNPAFKDTPQAKAIKALQKFNTGELVKEFVQFTKDYMEVLVQEMSELSRKGYLIYPEYENRIDDEEFVNDGVESYRKNTYQADYYKKHPLEEGKAKKNIAFPTFTVNGRTFCTYGTINEIGLLAGQDIVLDESKPYTKEALKLFARIESIVRKNTAAKGTYEGNDGKIGFSYKLLNLRFTQERTPLVRKLMTLLKNDVPAFGEYIKAHPDEFEAYENILPDNIEAYDFSQVLDSQEEELEINTASNQQKEEQIPSEEFLAGLNEEKRDNNQIDEKEYLENVSIKDELLNASDIEEMIPDVDLLGDKQQKLPQYNVSVNLVAKYEKQTKNNCWCCAGAAIFNQFVFNQDKELKHPVKQKDIRNFCPEEDEIRTIDEIREMGIDVDEKLYESDKEKMYTFMGKDRKVFGNLFEAADFFMNQRRDFQMNRLLFALPALLDGDKEKPKTEDEKKKDAIQYQNQLIAFVNQINEVLSTGNAVAMLDGAEQHYVTITKLQGDMVTVMDSNPKEGEDMEKTMSVAELFKRRRHGGTIELTWFSKLEEQEDLMKEFPQLQCNALKGYYTKTTTMEEALNLAHVEGVCVSKSEGELGPNMEGIGLSVYIPKAARKFSKEEKRVIRTMNKTLWNLEKSGNNVMESHVKGYNVPQEPITVEDDAFAQEMALSEAPVFGAKDRVSRRDPKQDANRPDSSLLAMLSGIALTNKDYIRDMVKEVDEDHVKVSLYDENGIRQSVIVRKTVPDPKRSVWPQLVEKAAAVLIAKNKDDRYDLNGLCESDPEAVSRLLFGRKGRSFSTRDDVPAAVGRIMGYLSAGKIVTATTCKNDPSCEEYDAEKDAVAFPVGLHPLQTHVILGLGDPMDGETTFRLVDPLRKHSIDLKISLFTLCFTNVYVAEAGDQ